MTDTGARTRLEDIEAIRILKARYFRCLDTKDWEGFGRLFAEDAQIGPLDNGFPDYLMDLRPAEAQKPLQSSGVDAFVARVAANIGPLITTHHGHQPEIEFTGADAATGIWAMEDVLVWPEHGYRLRGTGHYHETYRRVDEDWKFSSLRLTRLYAYVEKFDVSMRGK
ncbi:nuclear transport factor 2 family protein [Nocardioides sp. NPDC051685]|uniref:nuclear transport factor 2 family protein n=1 Tax=Nocardioides sp. NPDC051685 TaxID=3364334 RepID=UPI0037A4C7B9